MARKSRGNTNETMDKVDDVMIALNRPIVLRNSTETYSTNQPSQSSIGDSYNKMIGQYEPDISKFTGMLPSTNQFTEQPGKNGFYGSMSGLEGASMRLANAASQRSMAEAGYGSGLKRGETANEYGLRDISTAKEYGLKGGLLGQEYGLRDASTAKEYGLKGGLLGQEYALKDASMTKEYGLKDASAAKDYSFKTALSGYSSPAEMQNDIARQRRDNENRQREQERVANLRARGYSASGNLLPQFYPK
jgi:hypothetical protein